MDKAYLLNKLGPLVQQALQDDAVLEVMRNSDGKVWVKDTQVGNRLLGEMPESDARQFCSALAQSESRYLNNTNPNFDGVLPFAGERIAISIPPVTSNTTFNIRKRAKQIFTLAQYVDAKIMSAQQVAAITHAIVNRKNILVAGSPGSGKTTLTNAILAKMAECCAKSERILVLEDVPELQCTLPNTLSMLTSPNVSMRDLVFMAMRRYPERLIVGEVRDGAALDLLKAWNTGCPGGVSTTHANSCEAAVQRILDLSLEVSQTPPYRLAAESLQVFIHIEERFDHPAGRLVTEILEVTGFEFKAQQFHFQPYRDCCKPEIAG